MQIDILKLAEIIGAVALILTTVIGAYKLYDKLLDRVDKLEQRVGKLETELNRSLDGVKSLVLDFSKLDYISSAGLRVLLSAHKIMNARDGMKVKNVNEIVQEVLEVTGFADILTIEA